MSKKIIINIGQLITNSPLVEAKKTSQIQKDDLGILEDAWLSIDQNGRVEGYGSSKSGDAKTPNLNSYQEVIDARGSLVTPGLIDSHTHMVFAGDRSHEFLQKSAGATYQEVAAAGGGIKYTVRETRKASLSELTKSCEVRLQNSLRSGVTSIEIKSGYGLSVHDELKILQAANQAVTPQHKSMTCLALHDIPEDADSKTSFIREMTEQLLPEVKKQNLADWCDAFVEKGYFEPSDVTPYFEKAKKLGFGIRIHADEFSDSGACQVAADFGAASADHLQHGSDMGIEALKSSGAVATLLPGTSLCSNIKYSNGAHIESLGCPIAIASDFNPGSCQIMNLAKILTISIFSNKVSPWAAFAGVTWVGANSMKIQKSKGALAAGYDADFLIHEHKSLPEWLSSWGEFLPRSVWVQGLQVSS